MWYLVVLLVPDRDGVIGVGGDKPGVSGVELDLHDLVARLPNYAPLSWPRGPSPRASVSPRVLARCCSLPWRRRVATSAPCPRWLVRTLRCPGNPSCVSDEDTVGAHECK